MKSHSHSPTIPRTSPDPKAAPVETPIGIITAEHFRRTVVHGDAFEAVVDYPREFDYENGTNRMDYDREEHADDGETPMFEMAEDEALPHPSRRVRARIGRQCVAVLLRR